MTSQQHEVLAAARAAIRIEQSGKVVTADISKDPEKLNRLIRAVVALERNGGYWQER